MKNTALILSLLILPLCGSVGAFAEEPASFEIHNTKIDKTVTNCPKEEMDLAQEILELELAGMRYKKSKPSCFEALTMKYVHYPKNPDAAVNKVVSVVSGSAKIESLEYNEKFYSYKAVFSVKDKSGKVLKDSFSFMTSSSRPAAKKPVNGCALISVSPPKAYVQASCL